MAQLNLVLLSLLALLALAGCGTDITLRNSTPKVVHTAQLGSPAVFFLDKVQVPVLKKDRIGKIRAVSDAQWSWVYTKSDLSAWADAEWAAFFRHYGHTMVLTPKKSDYGVLCDVTEIYAEKFTPYSGPAKFVGHCSMRVTITRTGSGETVFARELKKAYSVAVNEGAATDEAAYNHCLSTAFQLCLEDIVLPQ